MRTPQWMVGWENKLWMVEGGKVSVGSVIIICLRKRRKIRFPQLPYLSLSRDVARKSACEFIQNMRDGLVVWLKTLVVLTLVKWLSKSLRVRMSSPVRSECLVIISRLGPSGASLMDTRMSWATWESSTRCALTWPA